MVLQHLGGSIEVDSSEGSGTVFKMHIPAVSAINDVELINAACQARSILIVDDREDVLEGLQSVILELGYHCDRASSAAVAANCLAARKYHLVLIDLDMPLKNGAELASENRRGEGPNKMTRLIAFSAATHLAEGSAWAFNDFLQKPVNKSTLKRIIEMPKLSIA
jgi:two-component system, OmpR family, sensor histidine kinase TorS